MAVSLILPVRLPVIPVGKAYGNTLNYLVFVDRKGEKIGLKSPISLFFSLLPGVRPPRRPVSQDCAHHQARLLRGPLSGAGDFGRLHAGLSQAGVEFRSDRGIIYASRGG